MRKLSFPAGSAALFYGTMYEGALNTERSFRAPSETRVLGSALTKIEAAGRPITLAAGTPAQRPSYEYVGGVVYLEEAEYDILKQALEHAPWNARAARSVTELMDWFHAAPSVVDMDENGVAASDRVTSTKGAEAPAASA